jgi:hypothetical protein
MEVQGEDIDASREVFSKALSLLEESSSRDEKLELSKEIFEKAYEASHLMSQFMQTKSHLARPSIAAEGSFFC